MDAGFWHRKWQRNDIAFHESDANRLLVAHYADWALPPGSRVFLPLCGKTLDIRWLLSRGHRIAGAELSPLAVEQLFAELGVTPAATEIGRTRLYHSEGIDVFVGDIFDLSFDVLGPVAAVYDRAALVALPADVRSCYAEHLIRLTGAARQLLITFDYDQALLDGPPFSIGHDEVARHYGATYDVRQLASVDVAGGLKGRCPAREEVWLLS
jgi:thiopurine S-methyltransferase